MKNQYFGDVNDYRKYGLLRILADDSTLKIGICWMLTDDDTSGHGNDMRYLEQPSKWHRYDPNLFNSLQKCVKAKGSRNVNEAEKLALVPSAIYYDELLKPGPVQRQSYFQGMFEKFAKTDLVFFDPDNGIEVPSVKLASKHAPKYLFWKELSQVFAKGHSVLVYQHFPREDHERFVTRIANEIRKWTDAGQIDAFITSKVVFFLASQERHQEVRRSLVEKVQERWHGQIRVENSVAK